MTMTPEERANYEAPDLARTLLVRLGLADPEQLNRMDPEEDKELLFHACDTTQGVNCAIRKVANALMQGKLDTKRANTLLYALQSCLATIRIEQEAGPPRPRPLRLAAAEFTEDTPCTATSPKKPSASAELPATSTKPTRATRSTPAPARAAQRGARRSKAKSAIRSKRGRSDTTRHTESTDDED
jgi:hypothetical protein